MIGVMPSSISAIQRPPPAGIRAAAEYVLPTTRQRAFPPLLGTCIHGWRSRRSVPNTAKIAFSDIEPAGDAPISDGGSMDYGANSLLGGTMEFLYRTTNFRRANNRITTEIL
jgi:hypothetical protein